MTESVQPGRVILAPNGVTTTFALPFRALTDPVTNKTNLIVKPVTISTGVIGAALTEGTDYTVSNVGSDTCSIVTEGASSPWGATSYLVAYTSTAVEQETTYTYNGPFPSADAEAALDWLTQIARNHEDRLNRSLKFSIAYPVSGALSADIPVPTLNGATIYWDTTNGWTWTTVSLAALQAQAAALYAIAAAITTVAGISANVTSVAGNASNINTVAGISANITTLADISSAISTVVGMSSAITTLNANATNVNTVAGISANVTTVAGISANVTTVAGISTDVTAVSTIHSNVTTVAGISGSVTTAAGISANITTVAGAAMNIANVAADLTAINAVAADLTAINTVNTNIANVNAVGGISANVTTVADIAPDVTAVSTIHANVTTVAGISANVTTVAGAAANMATIVANLTTITNAADNIPKANLAASVAPGVGNDNTQGYSAGSMWVDTTHSQVYFALSVAPGAAIWEQAFSASSLSGLSDVTVSSLASYDTLQYNSGTSKWNNVAAATALANLGGAPLASPTLTGTPLAPTATALTSNTQIATTAYVDTAVSVGISGLSSKGAVSAVSTANIAGTYLTGVFTVTATGALVIDGVTCGLNALVALVGQTATGGTGTVNGIYKVTTAGSGGVSAVLTRATNFNTSALAAAGGYFIVDAGTVNTGTFWVNSTTGPITLGTTVLTFTEVTVGTIALTGDVTLVGSAATVVNVAGRTVANNAVTVTSNAGTCPVTTLLDTFTNSSASAMTITLAVTGATDGQQKVVRIYDASAATKNITWVNTENGEGTAPTTSAGSTTLPLTTTFIFNAATTKWRCAASNLMKGSNQANASFSTAALQTTGSNVNINTAGQPSVGQTLIATSSTNANWATPVSSGGGYRVLASTDTVVASDNGKTLTIAGTCALALTAAATVGNFSCYVKNTATTGIANITITPNGSDNLDGSNTTLIILPGETRLLTCNGTAWFTEVVVPFTLYMTSTATPVMPRNGYVGVSGQLWGGGASGGAGATDGGGGGGGGGFNQFTLMNGTISVSSLALTCTIGAGGLSQTSANTAGNAGGLTTVVTGASFQLSQAYGGGAGGGSSLGAGGGGGSTGGVNALATGQVISTLGVPITSGVGNNAATTTAGAGGVDVQTSIDGSTVGGAAGSGQGSHMSGAGGGNATHTAGGGAYYGGGGGGASVVTTGAVGGNSMYGGAGGGGASNTTGGAGGGSVYGGAGGAGGSNGAGTQGAGGGGGGGGAVGTGGSGAGGGGRIILKGIC